MSTPSIPSRADILYGLNAICAETGVPGVSVAASHDGQCQTYHAGVAVAGTAEPLTEQSRFEVSCLMKFFVAIMAQKLIRRGLLDPSAAIGNYLPELAGSAAGARITVGHLLSHASGYHGLDVMDARIKWGHSWQKLVDQIRGAALLFPPGEVFSYEHSEHVLAGGILQRIACKTLDQMLREELLDPLGISVGQAKEDRRVQAFVGQHVPGGAPGKFAPVNQPPFSGFWRASLPDMTIRLKDVVRIGNWLLQESNAWFRSILERQVICLPAQATAGPQTELIPTSFGQVCGRYDGGFLGHNGSMVGQTVALRIDPARRAVFAAGVNAWVPFARDRAIRLVSGRETARNEAANSAPAGSDGIEPHKLTGGFSVTDLAGTYDGGFARQVVVEREDDGLSMLVGAPGSRRRRITVARRPDGRCEFGPNQHVSCTFTAHPEDGSPVFHLGVHAYRRRL